MKRSCVSERVANGASTGIVQSEGRHLLILCHRLSRALLLILVMDRLMCDVEMSEEAEMQRGKKVRRLAYF